MANELMNHHKDTNLPTPQTKKPPDLHREALNMNRESA